MPYLSRVAINGLRTTGLIEFLTQTAESLGERSD
jgi:hypothetical protein